MTHIEDQANAYLENLMTIQLTLGRTTFLIRREPAERTARLETSKLSTSSFATAWMQIFNGTWESKAGASFPKQFAKQRDNEETETKNE